tara:strand:+ start:62 stop:277 length:216 start_codon:yes stop_codon:yes gene_type:complete
VPLRLAATAVVRIRELADPFDDCRRKQNYWRHTSSAQADELFVFKSHRPMARLAVFDDAAIDGAGCATKNS